MREWIVPDEDIGVDGAYYGYQELLRCKDCKWFGVGYMCYNTETLGMKPDDFCSLAERKANESRSID